MRRRFWLIVVLTSDVGGQHGHRPGKAQRGGAHHGVERMFVTVQPRRGEQSKIR
ncbi:hypothetical protein [Streptosporangium sp. NBC_01756]|uniref:hypothetical protein n=1 Tax=Streptosporangium sp. NBC_01756 TaxID=2975950 RepID=UPI002DDC35A0|nr:hypothetical protein [Streptosporangium sp. NBC_01756]